MQQFSRDSKHFIATFHQLFAGELLINDVERFLKFIRSKIDKPLEKRGTYLHPQGWERLIAVNSIQELIEAFKCFWGKRPLHRRPRTLVFTYGYDYDVIKELAVLSQSIRVITGRDDVKERIKVDGLPNAKVSYHNTHFKGIYADDYRWTFMGIGSWNMVKDYGSRNAGFVLLAWNAFPLDFNELNEPHSGLRFMFEFRRPFLEQLINYTGGRCETCKQQTRIIYVASNGSLVCGECEPKIFNSWAQYITEALYSESEKEQFWKDEIGF